MSAAALRRLDRAHARDRWATSGIRSGLLARHYGVAAATARSLRTRVPKGPLTKVLAMLADPAVPDDAAGRIMATLIAGFEERIIYRPTGELRSRLKHLRESAEHVAQAAQDRALMIRESQVQACLNHASLLIEIAVHVDMLEPEPETTH